MGLDAGLDSKSQIRSGDDGRREHTASLIGDGLRMDPHAGQEHAVGTLIGTPILSNVIYGRLLYGVGWAG